MGDKLYDKAVLAFKKLQFEKGDALFIYFPKDIAANQMAKTAEVLQPLVEHHGISLFCLREGLTVQHIEEKKMNQMGWFKHTEKMN